MDANIATIFPEIEALSISLILSTNYLLFFYFSRDAVASNHAIPPAGTPQKSFLDRIIVGLIFLVQSLISHMRYPPIRISSAYSLSLIISCS